MTITSPLIFSGVALAQGGRLLCASVDGTLPARSMTLLQGGNGTGKTTLLRSVLGLHAPAGGRITVLGAAPEDARSRIGYLPQSLPLLAPWLPARAFVAAAWHGTRFGLPGWGRKCREAVDEALASVDALGLAHRPMIHLSGGERQRIGLATALLDRPRLLLLDEPLAGLDVAHQAELASLLHHLQDTAGVTILVSVHGASPLDAVADYRMVLHEGGAFFEPVNGRETGDHDA